MSGASSRHDGAPTYAATLNGEPVTLLRPRFAPDRAAALQHVVVAGDRLDLLAWRYFGDPLQYWRIVDANPTLAPEALLEIGRVLTIPRSG